MIALRCIVMASLQDSWIPFVARIRIAVVGVDRRVIIVTVDDGLAWLTDSEIPGLAKYLAGDQRSTFCVEDLATSAAMVLSSKGGKSISAVEAVFSILISHPKLAVKDLSSHVRKGITRHVS